MSAGSHIYIGAVFALAGFVKGSIGLGLPTISMGLLALVMPPVEAAAILIVPSFVTNVWQLLAGQPSPASRGGFGRCCWRCASGLGREAGS